MTYPAPSAPHTYRCAWLACLQDFRQGQQLMAERNFPGRYSFFQVGERRWWRWRLLVWCSCVCMCGSGGGAVEY